ncbi:MAG: hypothetical protein PHE51_06635 [Eubacteriales bacterium]|nr:hypothetical protein [Eubacteriales bacterium]
MIDSSLFSAVKSSEYEEIEITEGDILKIHSNGKLERRTFEYSNYYSRDWWDFGFYSKSSGNEYVDDLKSVASYMGYSPNTIDELLDGGFSPEEIEEYIYCMEGEV